MIKHTRQWFKENYGVDPSKLGLPPISKKPLLWDERDVMPYKDEKVVFLVSFYETVKRLNPRVKEIVERLYVIGKEIEVLHEKKLQCRKDKYNTEFFFDMGIQHCPECTKLTEEQNKLREEREKLFNEMETISGIDKQSIQLARKYYREVKKVN